MGASEQGRYKKWLSGSEVWDLDTVQMWQSLVMTAIRAWLWERVA